MSDERTILDYLEDISNAILDIRLFVHDMSAEAFMADKKTVNAVVRSLEVIGEATGKIPKDIRIREKLVAVSRPLIPIFQHLADAALDRLWVAIG
jgi:uncharacterized protein with HEPN domain